MSTCVRRCDVASIAHAFQPDFRSRSGTLTAVIPADAIHIEYTAPAGCPSEAAFAWQVHARVRQVPAPARKYVVVLAVDGARARGTLRVEEESRSTVREISGTSCDEIAEGLALVLALVIDPGARTDPARDLPPQPPPERPLEPKPPTLVPAPLPNGASDAPLRPRPAVPPARLSISAGGSAVARSGPAPGTATAGDVFLEGGLDRRGGISPHLKLGFEYAKSSPFVESVGTAQFTWMIGMARACHAEQVLERTLVVPICAGLEWGRVEASGSETPDARTQKQTWLSLDASVGLRWFPWNAPLFVDVEGGLEVPLRRARFYFEPGITVHTTPRVAQFVGLGAGLRLF
jgi:hypothetical protein